MAASLPSAVASQRLHSKPANWNCRPNSDIRCAEVIGAQQPVAQQASCAGEGRAGSRELALLNLGIDSKLLGCDLVALKVRDISHGEQIAPRAIVQQSKTRRPVQFEITPVARQAVKE